MGPRPFGRGDYGPAGQSVCPPRFNGAAAFRPRRHGPAAHSALPSRFNGAAAFRPRRPEGVVASGFAPTLQWGRGLSAAETSSARKATAGQTGFNGAAAFRPRRRARDGNYRQTGDASMGPRPFGRGDIKAAATRAKACCFNGAAAFRPRRRIARSTVSAASKLQWGRGLSAAETAGLASCVVITTYARVCEREGYVRQVFGHIQNPAVHKSLLVKDLPSRERAQDPPPPPSRSRGYSPENTAKTPRPQWRPAPNAMGPAASSLKISLAQRSGHLRR